MDYYFFLFAGDLSLMPVTLCLFEGVLLYVIKKKKNPPVIFSSKK